MAEQLEHNNWAGTTGGMPWMQRLLVRVLGFMDQRLVYVFMAVVVVPGYMLFAHKGYIAQYHFFRQRMGDTPLKAFLHVYVNHFRFGQIIIDRFAVYGGKHFDFEMEGYDHWQEVERQPEGFVQLSSHIGNYEMAGYSIKVRIKKFNALVFFGEAATVMSNRAKLFTPNNIAMIPVMPDMSHIFLLNNALADGGIVSMPADRIFGSQKCLSCRLLGAEARFPLGPFSLALSRNCPIIGVWVMKKNWHTYHILIRDIGEEARRDPTWETMKKTARLQLLADTYVARLEEVIRLYPTQWFNYYEFWQ